MTGEATGGEPKSGAVAPALHTGHVERAVAAAVWELKTVVAQYPSVAMPLARLRGHGGVAAPDTDILIEGFVRSGLSFTVAAFRLAQEPRFTSIAHHTHAPAPIVDATRRGIPTLLLIRRPRDAVLSYIIKTPAVSVAAALRGYVRFHRPLLPYRGKVVVATFDEVTSDLGSVIERVNRRFATSFAPFEGTPENLVRLRREIEDDWRVRGRSPEERERGVPRPSSMREELKRRIAETYDADSPARTRHEAEHLYSRFLATAR